MISKICDRCDVTADWLLGRDEKSPVFLSIAVSQAKKGLNDIYAEMKNINNQLETLLAEGK